MSPLKLQDNSFYHFHKLNQSISIAHKEIEIHILFLAFRFLLHISAPLNFFDNTTNFFPNFNIYLSKKKFQIYQNIHTLSFIKITFIYNLFWKEYFSASLQPIKYLKYRLPKGSLLDTTILLIYMSFIKIGHLC